MMIGTHDNYGRAMRAKLVKLKSVFEDLHTITIFKVLHCHFIFCFTAAPRLALSRLPLCHLPSSFLLFCPIIGGKRKKTSGLAVIMQSCSLHHCIIIWE